jgi:hypothetical protein
VNTGDVPANTPTSAVGTALSSSEAAERPMHYTSGKDSARVMSTVNNLLSGLWNFHGFLLRDMLPLHVRSPESLFSDISVLQGC